MTYVNTVHIFGFLGTDITIHQMANGGEVANFSVGTDESYTDPRTKKRVKQIEWHRVVAYAPDMLAYLEKTRPQGQDGHCHRQTQNPKVAEERPDPVLDRNHARPPRDSAVRQRPASAVRIRGEPRSRQPRVVLICTLSSPWAGASVRRPVFFLLADTPPQPSLPANPAYRRPSVLPPNPKKKKERSFKELNGTSLEKPRPSPSSPDVHRNSE